MTNFLKITYIRSAQGHPSIQSRTVQALGLRRLHHTEEQPDNPCIRGMVKKICHLLKVEELQK